MTLRQYHAPGRVNLIGEHTDYNDGFVMPVAIDRGCRVWAESRDDGRLTCRSANAAGDLVLERDGTPSRTGDWRDYVTGVALLLRQHAIRPGASLTVESDLPLGAGLASSAALEVAVAIALIDLAGAAMPPTDIARLCQRAENEFVGAACGIMDQYIACHARLGSALLLDCRTLQHRHIPIPAETSIVICDSRVRHAHAGGEYNRRRSECQAAAAALGIPSLRDATLDDLDGARERLGPLRYRRARHVVTENARALAMADALERGALEDVGPLMAASHQSLAVDYEVSCAELDALVDVAAQAPGVYGARMTGGGFGGCTVQLVAADAVETFRSRVAAPATYVSRASGAAGRVEP